MHPLQQLRKILQKSQTNNGRVISASSTEILIATTKGSTRLPRTPGDVTNYQSGDTVILANGQVVGRRLRSPAVYVV